MQMRKRDLGETCGDKPAKADDKRGTQTRKDRERARCGHRPINLPQLSGLIGRYAPEAKWGSQLRASLLVCLGQAGAIQVLLPL